MEYLFVYGTLMHDINSAMSRFLTMNSSFLGEATMAGYLYDIGQYPGAVFDPQSSSCVGGHIFHLHDANKVFEVLDAYEGIDWAHPDQNEYRRELVPIDFQGDQPDCWVYLYNGAIEGLYKISHGNYHDYIKNNPVHQEFIKSGR